MKGSMHVVILQMGDLRQTDLKQIYVQIQCYAEISKYLGTYV